MTNQCIGLFGRLFGHKYVSAYDTKPPAPEHLQGVKITQGAVQIFDTLSTKTYRGSVCTRCGRVSDDRLQCES